MNGVLATRLRQVSISIITLPLATILSSLSVSGADSPQTTPADASEPAAAVAIANVQMHLRITPAAQPAEHTVISARVKFDCINKKTGDLVLAIAGPARLASEFIFTSPDGAKWRINPGMDIADLTSCRALPPGASTTLALKGGSTNSFTALFLLDDPPFAAVGGVSDAPHRIKLETSAAAIWQSAAAVPPSESVGRASSHLASGSAPAAAAGGSPEPIPQIKASPAGWTFSYRAQHSDVKAERQVLWVEGSGPATLKID